MNNVLVGEITPEMKKNDSRLLAAGIFMQITYCQGLNQDHGITTLNLITDLSSPIKYRYDRSFIVSPKELKDLETMHRDGKELSPDLINRIGVQIQQWLAAYAMDFLHHNHDEESIEIDEFLSYRLSDYGEKIPLPIQYLTIMTGKKDDEHFWDWTDSVHISALVYYFKEALEDVKKYHGLILKVADQIFEKVEFNERETSNLIKWIEEKRNN